MTIAFPNTTLIAGLPIRDGYFEPMWRQETSTTAGGVSQVKDLGPMLWRAQYQTAEMERDEALDVETDLMTLRGGIELFEGFDPRRPEPKNASSGHDLSSVTVHEIRADQTGVRLAGLPTDFVAAKSDYLSVDDGTNLHLLRCASGALTFADGLSDWIEVIPFLRPTIEVGDPVQLRFPCARYRIERDSVDRVRVDSTKDALSFTAMQVIE